VLLYCFTYRNKPIETKEKKMRKTISVKLVATQIQNQILLGDKSERARLCGLLEYVLHEADAYRGFRFCDSMGDFLSAEDAQKLVYDCMAPGFYLRMYCLPE
jgi:hypothetical protein